MTMDTLFDLVSITKVMATTQSVMVLVDRGEIYVEDKVSRHLRGFAANGREDITIAQSLIHSAGLLPGRPTYLTCHSRAEQLALIEREHQVEGYDTDGTEPVYADFSFMTLGFLVEAVTGQDMDVFVHENMYEPLGMHDTAYNRLQRGFSQERIAAAALGYPYEYRMVNRGEWVCVRGDRPDEREAFARFTGWRQGTLIGEVSDGNAGIGGQGVAGHVGLFLRQRTWLCCSIAC